MSISVLLQYRCNTVASIISCIHQPFLPTNIPSPFLDYLQAVSSMLRFLLNDPLFFLFHTDFHRLCQTILHLFAFVLCLLHFMYFTITSAPPDELRNHLPVAQMSLYPPSDSVFLLSISSGTHEIQYCLLL